MWASGAVSRPPAVKSSRFEDMDTMARALVGDSIDFVPLSSGPFHGRFCQLDMPGFLFKRIAHSPVLIHGAVRPDRVALQVLGRPADGMTLNGDAFDATMLAVMAEDAPLQRD